MSDEQELSKGGGLQHPGLSRRRMLRRSVGVAAPVALTLVSNPVSATTTTCVNASVFVSQVAMSSRPPKGVTCNGGNTPTDWYGKHKDLWPAACKYNNGTGSIKKLKDVFGSPQYQWSGCSFSDSTTLKDALVCNNEVAKDIVAAYINACNTDFSSVLSKSEVVRMWQSLYLGADRRYQPAGTTFSWDRTMTRNWLTYMR